VEREGWHARAVKDGGAAEAVLWAGPAPGADAAALLTAAASRAGWLLERGRLREGLERAMTQVLEDDERMLGRMGLDIHDGPTQQLSVALLEIQLLDAELADAESNGAELPASLRPGIGRIYETLGGALHEMRELIGHLRPAQFQDRSLDDILGDAIAAFEARTDVPVDRRMRGEFSVNGVSVSQRITFYRILQEALANAHRHGRASAVTVDVSSGPAGTELVVEDDGIGFDAAAALREWAQTPPARHGLHGMQDRARLLGGTFHVESAPGRGTTLSVFLPPWQPTGPLHEAAGDH
jgi:signal transduction histidine kinase